MNSKLSGWDDTIVALATPPGIGAIGVIRLSGKEAITVADRLFPSKDLSIQPSHTLHVGMLKDGERSLDEVVVSLFKGPKSYTGEDVVEISCHGSPYILENVVLACTDHGARLARPGEFTMRAFLNGKLDLAQAEGVADLIAANSSASQQTALQHLKGGFSKELKHLREELIRFSALIELELDFSQEDVEFADRTTFKQLISDIIRATDILIGSFKLGNAIRNGVQVAIIGKPNAGKSSLLNALLQEDRAIVSDIAGTTRDTIEEVLNINGILFRLIDTAGIRQHTADVIESIGMEKSREKLEQADLVLLISDAVRSLQQQHEADQLLAEVLQSGKPYIHVMNKSDLILNEEDRKTLMGQYADAIFMTARTGEGMDALKDKLYAAAISGETGIEDTVVTNARHLTALQKLSTSLKDVEKGLNDGIPGDLLALDIRQCLHFLGEITGEITHEDQLDLIFSKFCIGK